MGKRLQRIWRIITSAEAIWSLFQYIGLPKIITGVVGGASMSVWSVSQHIPTPYIAVVALLVFTLIIWAWNGITWQREKKKGDIKTTPSLIKPLQEQYSWLDGLIQRQRSSPQNYLHARLHRLFIPNLKELGFEVEFFNGTIFGLVFNSVAGEVTINDVSLGHQLKIRGDFSCSPGGYCICTLDIEVDPSVIQLIRESSSKKCG